MEYVTPEAGREMTGLRLALTRGVPAPYSMSAKAVFDLHGVAYAAVEQIAAAENEDLKAWTGHRNAPIALFDDEAPRVGWLEILNLAERIGNGPSLIPGDLRLRLHMVGLINELIGENGLVWNMRLIMLGLGGPERAAAAAEHNPMFAQYGYSETARAAAESKVREVLDYLTAHAREQRDRGAEYLVGSDFSALDVYWAYFSLLLQVLPDQQCPMPSGLKKSYELASAAIGGCDPLLIEQRDWIFKNHLTLPMDF